ncbi:PREDICTED: U-box domain-containing protein 3-like isoform X2 [Nelumbo nucifera]|uniref:RING-type E3 ubiquitin transferase n=2 Tax=Nelumbo nucifera TaxID=4432 RepID=A0A822YZV1_NELNU|nr:PREDICTED: U-box domain-containing protein 3-like isoform X2 [Nelumbo nucifera]DAD36789.1 TPA_asm: hypothetical protein HUJ06_007430 [Nelumbo nucifera]
MDTRSIRCLVNSFSRFIHLAACQTVKSVPIQKDYRYMVGLLKLLKPVLDEVVDHKVPMNEHLLKECEEMDVAVNEAREFMEKWSSKMSKICSVLQSEPLATKIQRSSMEICHILCRTLQSSQYASLLAHVQKCIQEIQCFGQEKISELIEEAMIDQRNNVIPRTENLIKIVEILGLTSNHELLAESIALEKERMKDQFKTKKEELDHIDQIVYLVANIRNCMVKLEPFVAINGVPIPSYFRCPLSLELMLDPVIVASGQTYERAFIQKWLDHGLTLCPQTRQTLTHTNLIPNYTVKALIRNWCDQNNIRLCNTSASNNISGLSLFGHTCPQYFIHTDSFHGSLNSSISTSRSSLVGNGSEMQRVEVSSGHDEEANVSCSKETPKCDQPSPEQSYIHSRSESVSSAISSIEYVPTALTVGLSEQSRVSSKHGDASELSGEVTSKCTSFCAPNKSPGCSPLLSGKQFYSSKIKVERTENECNDYNRSLSLPLLDSGLDNMASSSYVEKLVEDLKSQSNEVQTAAATELRLLGKHNMENRIIIAQCGAIPPLVSLLYSDEKMTQEHAVTALLNLSINDDNKAMIAEAGAIEPLIHVLKTGNAGAKENSAATLFSLSVLEQYKVKIGRSGAVKALVDLLRSGTLRGKKDAATALFNLSISHENKARIVRAGAVKYLVEMLDPATGMLEKAVALLANLSTIPEGCSAIGREGGIPPLVEILETGSQRGKENAASILLQLCINSRRFCTLVLQEGAVPPLVALSQSGTTRAKEKYMKFTPTLHWSQFGTELQIKLD